MKKLLWKLRYALDLSRRSGLSLWRSWQCAETGWESQADFPCAPSEAVDEELACWGD